MTPGKMVNKKINKKAELTTQQIVLLIVLVVSFIVILYFLFNLGLQGKSDKEICHNSVNLVAKSSSFIGTLDCKTNYLCISGGNQCEAITKETVKVDPKDKTQVVKALADEMSDCWWQFGEGKTDYTSTFFAFSDKACAICSIVKFDAKTQKSSPEITYQDLYNYLRTTKKTNSQSYLQYIYSANTLDSIQQFYLSNYLNNKIDTTKEYFILTGMSKTRIVWIPFGTKHIPVTILEVTQDNYNKIGCDKFLTKA